MQTVIEQTDKTGAAPKKSGRKAPASAPLAAIAEVKLVPLDLIDAPEQLRKEFDQESIEDLAGDIAARGLIQPILLNPTGDRFRLIAGERRLRAVKLNGATGIPALLVKASTDEALLMQLAENIQREDLSLEEECDAVVMLHKLLGSLETVAATVKKSKSWCSKRFAMKQEGLHYLANNLLEAGITEDIELLKALSSLFDLVGWTDSNAWEKKVREGTAGRNEIRAALKAAKEADKVKRAKAAAQAGKVSHAKPKEPPPPPPWTIGDAMDDLAQAMTYTDSELSAAELLSTWTAEQRLQVEERFGRMRDIGRSEGGFKLIGKLVTDGLYRTEYTDIDVMAMISGYGNRAFTLDSLLDELQCPREKA